MGGVPYKSRRRSPANCRCRLATKHILPGLPMKPTDLELAGCVSPGPRLSATLTMRSTGSPTSGLPPAVRRPTLPMKSGLLPLPDFRDHPGGNVRYPSGP